MKRMVVGLAVVVLVASVGAGTATAHKKQFSSSATLAIADKDAAGTVGSAKKKCRKKRTVKVFRQAAAGPPFPAELVATTKSNRVGRWAARLSGKTKGETFFAKARKKVLRKNRRHKHVCRGATSGTVTVPDKVK